MTYRAVLSETNHSTTVELVSYIKQWIAITRSIVVQSVHLGINSTCPVVITEFDSPECPKALDRRVTSPTTTPPVSGDNLVIAGAIVGILIIVIAVAVIVVIVVLVMKHRKTGPSNVQTNGSK